MKVLLGNEARLQLTYCTLVIICKVQYGFGQIHFIAFKTFLMVILLYRDRFLCDEAI